MRKTIVLIGSFAAVLIGAGCTGVKPRCDQHLTRINPVGATVAASPPPALEAPAKDRVGAQP